MKESSQLRPELPRATMSLRVKKRSKCREGSPHFIKLLIQAAHGAKLKRGSFYRAKYNQWKFKLGSANKAKVAVANRIARAIYKIIAGDKYKELGYLRGDPKEHKIKLLAGFPQLVPPDFLIVCHS